MVFLLALLSEAASVVAILFCLLLAWSLFYHFSTTQMPSGICQPLKVRILHILVVMIFTLGYILWKLGLCGQFAFMRIFVDGIPAGKDPRLSITNTYFEHVPIRIYHPKRPLTEKRKGILFFHGGNGTLGSIDAYDRACRSMAWKADAVVVSVGYRLAPEYLYPTQFEDCATAAEYFMKNAEDYGVSPAQIVIAGESIGGTAAASIVQKLTKRADLPKVRAQMLIGPFLQGVDFNSLSYQQNRWVPFVAQADFLYCIFLYVTKNTTIADFALEETHIPEERRKMYEEWLNPDHIPKELKVRGNYTKHQKSLNPLDHVYSLMETITGPTLGPLLSEDVVLQQLPETFILTSEFDILRDDGLLYKKRLEDNGVPVSWCHLTDGFHGVLLLYKRWFLNFAFCHRGVDHVVDFIKSL
ncbi:hypothetical protein JRQ81_009853 [Phrynocephalus forsythii]|uniref:Alpha/beta hydrolase fold-3 domain-containing protein n=1 Tax=Phrynocephalus forsythii TaxID=171643 RepID=A0A9Q0XAZ1_9SAUR|nr:hypothetical protein JRQ81_009853 [Phrynocephalus forsythii]